MTKKAHILLFAPTPAEYAGVKAELEKKTFFNFSLELLESGPGKINAAAGAAEAVLRGRDDPTPLILAGVGTSGSLSLRLRGGDMVFSLDSVVSDWRLEDGDDVKIGPYGVFDYAPPSQERVELMAVKETAPELVELSQKLERNGFFPGRILTSDTFVCGKDYKLALGKVFGALVCDMESGAFAYLAQKKGLRFFNLRVVADTLDENLADYFKKEGEVAGILGFKTVEVLEIFDSLLK
ncbi:MAG: hypothetical protein LBR53_03185 [Deltaproteobacteria bacterium]|jgi:nucleoside phosphorylase|nr:hypothetical protein [Deltaproteobacteria bacterium]